MYASNLLAKKWTGARADRRPSTSLHSCLAHSMSVGFLNCMSVGSLGCMSVGSLALWEEGNATSVIIAWALSRPWVKYLE